MTEFLLVVAGLALSFLVALGTGRWRARRARRALAQVRVGGRARIRARLSAGGGRSRAGGLVLTPARAVWTGRGGHRVDLTGGRVVSSGLAASWFAREDDIALEVERPGGEVVELTLLDADEELVTEALADLSASGPRATGIGRSAGSSWWGWVLVVVGACWVAAVGLEAVLSYPATVTVVSGDTDLDDGWCPVVWQGPDRVVHHGESDCMDDPPATTIDVLVSTWLYPGEPATPGLLVGMACIPGVPLLALGTWRVLHVHGRRRELAGLLDER